ncbi:hypothetical protein A3H16_00180 [Candidatus Kaiserbacteria bacterium RIFCSPLOWO2_12_FULL_53_8]|uniref:Putative pre-16S rRNA nuclease n=2 Tax=Candidatus Kaiseribacteriota TaxID=1752734 RepID=A0A1F6CTM2_9BACT|nr:MAG: hypothetical protein A2851_04960 [Candidatus Kaiserbacteria bacterium RIFCSPHIGHO2_01_FULL_53_29]OGG90936.1 MAG: hypothetical protein A3H16_00180 [Candidatus Kaiserbacteria bacterium RIFCSPLOWO2_12_FULL_53_8]
MKYLGIDYGRKRVGVAVSDAEGKIAFPRTTVTNDDKLLSGLLKLIQNEKIGRIVVGDTRASGGAENPITFEAQAFVEELTKATSVPIEFASEMWSSIEASRYAPENKAHDDGAAAAIILQRYLEMKGGEVE